MGSKILPDSLLVRLIREGKNDTQIRDYLREHESITVTRQAISAWRSRRGNPMRPMVEKAVPWVLRPEHVNSEPARAIRWYRRRELGLPIDDNETTRLNRVVAHLDHVAGVLHYEPSQPQGWVIAPRRPGIDLGIVRVP
jgi:hypothetical protein